MSKEKQMIINGWINEIVDCVPPTPEEIGSAIDALHAQADENDRIHSIPAFRMLQLGE